MNVTVHVARRARASSCSISGVWRWRADLVRRDVLAGGDEVRRLVDARPAPETPDLASITTSAISPARASGASAEQRGGRVAAGVGDEVGAARSRRGAARAARRRPRRAAPGAACAPYHVLVGAAVAQAEVGADRSTTRTPRSRSSATTGAAAPCG